MKHKSQRTINRLLFMAGILIPSILIGGTLMLRHTALGQNWLRQQWVDEFGFVSLPLMAFLGFAAITVLVLGATVSEDARVED